MFRLITRSDMDGLIRAVLLKELNLVEEVIFAHPKDMQDGLIEVTDNDIIANLPYNKNSFLTFDHHESEIMRNEKHDNHIINHKIPSSSRVIYDYYGGKESFPNVSEDMMLYLDKADLARFTQDDLLNPKGWDLLNFIMDSRTGLGRFKDFRISNYKLMLELIDYCRNHSIEEILRLPDVLERINMYNHYSYDFQKQLRKCSRKYCDLIVLDLRNEEIIYPGNRYMIYALYPECNASIHVINGLKKQNTVFATGKSIINRNSKINIGELMLKYGGGGHSAAGTCQIENEKSHKVLNELIKAINLIDK